MNSLRAIIVDDDADIIDILRDRLAVLGHEVVGVGCISEARKHLEEEHYDYMLLDMELPAYPGGKASPTHGPTFLQELREKYTKEQLPVIIITGKVLNDSNLTSAVFWTGANDYITKPFCTEGHTIEGAIMRFVVAAHGKAPAAPVIQPEAEAPKPLVQNTADAAWLTCVRDQDGNSKHWTTVGKGGLKRHINTRVNTAINKVLECIEHNHTMQECIVKHGEFIDKHIWKDEKTYFGGKLYEGNAADRPIRHHLNRIRKELGIGYKSIKGGYQFTQPEN